jgi:hypothetical protein
MIFPTVQDPSADFSIGWDATIILRQMAERLRKFTQCYN